jgi:hypothetical protein
MTLRHASYELRLTAETAAAKMPRAGEVGGLWSGLDTSG